MVRSEPDGVSRSAQAPLAQFLVRRRGTASKERERVLHPIDNRQRDVHAIDFRNMCQVLGVVEQCLDRASVNVQAWEALVVGLQRIGLGVVITQRTLGPSGLSRMTMVLLKGIVYYLGKIVP
jgi:hypothetical protein